MFLNTTQRVKTRFLAGAGAVAILTAGMSFSAYAQAGESVVEFDLPAQDLAKSLKSYGVATDRQVMFATTVVRGKQANEVSGDLTPTDALDKLLDGLGLVYETTSSNVILVKAEAQQEASRDGMFRVAQADREDGRDVEKVSDRSDEEEDREIDVIVVTGTNIRGVGATGAASFTFNRDDIESTGFSSVEELFESLPQNLDEISSDGAFSDGVSRIADSNVQGASSVSLRGLGPGSTLVLLNGRRRPGNINGRVFDISAIPLSMIERVEVVTGGRSAIYGSDAVAGVVNIVTRSEYDGAETDVSYGAADAGGARFSVSQTLGKTFDRGGFVLGYNYRKDKALDATDAGAVLDPPGSSVPIPGLFPLRALSEQHVGFFSGSFNLSDSVQFYADAHFSSDINEAGSASTIVGCCDFAQFVTTKSKQYSFSGGVRVDVGSDWQLDVSGLSGVVDNTLPAASPCGAPGTITNSDFPPDRQIETETKIQSISAIADGSLFAIGGGDVSAALGVEFRNETYEAIRVAIPEGTVTPNEDGDRDVYSIFGELHVPLIGGSEQRLDVSLAGRYDDYSDFGSTFNPQFGVEWEPLRGLTLRGSYSEAFRAPDLVTLALENAIFINTVSDPAGPSGSTATQFTELGGNPDLQPETAETYTLGVDWQSDGATRLSFSYFNIKYSNRIDEAVPSLQRRTVLRDAAVFGDLINRNPTSAQLSDVLGRATDIFNQTGISFDPATDDPFATFSNIVIFDDRRNNIGLEAVDGFDFQASTELETDVGDWSFGVNGTYYLNFERNITVSSPTIDQLNQPGKTIDLRLRGHIGWSWSAWSIDSYINYIDDYVDTLAATPTKIDSWTTVDLTLRFDASEISSSPYLDGLRASLAIDNLFDEDPPFFGSNTAGLNYDPANADAIGRFVSIRLSKEW